MDDESARRSELRQHLGDRAHELRGIDADHLSTCARRVRERAEHVEDGTRGELAPHGRGVPHRRVVRGREEEAEAELVDRARYSLGRLVEVEAQGLEHVGRAAGRGHGPVAVLGHPGSGRRRNERRGGRDVDRPCAVAAGARGVDEVAALRPYRQRVLAHRLRAAGDLVRGLALGTQRDQKACDLGGRRLAAHDRSHHTLRLFAGEIVSVEQPCQRLLDHAVASKKFRARVGPTGVSTDSGWNWTPSTGSERWRTAITSFSGQDAETSSSSGTAIAASEW